MKKYAKGLSFAFHLAQAYVAVPIASKVLYRISRRTVNFIERGGAVCELHRGMFKVRHLLRPAMQRSPELILVHCLDFAARVTMLQSGFKQLQACTI